jgi:hypothetical protein
LHFEHKKLQFLELFAIVEYYMTMTCMISISEVLAIPKVALLISRGGVVAQVSD